MHDFFNLSGTDVDQGTIGITSIKRTIPSIWLSTGLNAAVKRLPGDIHTIHRFYYYYDESLIKKTSSRRT